MNNDQLDIIIKAQNMAKSELDNLSGQIDGLESKTNLATKAFGLMSIATVALAGTAVAFGVSSVKAFNESASAMAQTDAVLKSTSGSAGVTRDQVLSLATALESNSRYADENIQSAENMLLTFTNISSKVFPQTTQAVLDMSTAMGQDLQSTAIQVGKALQDPVLGATALQRVGVRLTETQKESIKHFVAVGDAASAQGVILKELQTEFGGSAAAAGNTFAGQLDKLKNTLNNVQEGIGGMIAQALTPMIATFMAWFDSVGGVDGILKILVKTFTPIIDGIVDIARKIGDYLAPKFEDLWKTIQTKILPVLQDLWKNVILPLIPVIGTTLVGAIGFAVDALNNIIKAVSWVVDAIKTGNPWVTIITASFVALAGALAIAEAIKTVSAAFTIFTLVTMPAADLAISTFVATVLAPIIMPAIAVGAALAAIALVWNAYNNMMNAIQGEKDAMQSSLNTSKQIYAHASQIINDGVSSPEQKAAQKHLVNVTAKIDGGGVIYPGFATGGYTGSGSMNDVAGVVHKGEYVLSQNEVNQSTGKPKNGAGGDSIQNYQTVTIGTVILSSASAVTEFFNKLDQDGILVGKGLTPNRGTS